jgi:hypothetical protein
MAAEAVAAQRKNWDHVIRCQPSIEDFLFPFQGVFQHPSILTPVH